MLEAREIGGEVHKVAAQMARSDARSIFEGVMLPRSRWLFSNVCERVLCFLGRRENDFAKRVRLWEYASETPGRRIVTSL